MNPLESRLSEFMKTRGYKELCGGKYIKRYNTEAEQRKLGDVQIEIDGKYYNVEEKANGYTSTNCLLELIQSLELPWDDKKTRGWFYDLHECDFLMHGYFASRDSEKPSELYMMAWKQLREEVFGRLKGNGKKGEQYKTVWVPAGMGITLCLYVPYDHLEKCIRYKWPKEEEQNELFVDTPHVDKFDVIPLF